MNTSPQINIIIPLFNEEDTFNRLIERIKNVISTSGLKIEAILVDDGSTDSTPKMMESLSLKDPNFQSIILSRNFGHQRALTAGMKFVNASKAVLIMDGDLQDPPELLPEFYKKMQQGYDIVYAVRKDRKENYFKCLCYKAYYKLQKSTSNICMPIDSGDFSLLSRKIVDELNKMPEESRYIRGMRSWLGFKQTGITVVRDKRFSGKSKYSYSNLFKLAMNGIFNFSEFPMRLVFGLGMTAILISLIYFIYVLFEKLAIGTTPKGFTALLFTIILFGGLQLLSISLIGNYVVRIFFQVKNRPLFIIKKRIAGGKTSDEEK